MSNWILADRLVISAFAAILVMAAIGDVRRFRIPNAVSLALLFLYPLHAVFSPHAVLSGLIAFAVVGAVALVLFARGWMGGGDVKLMAVCALWAGAEQIGLFVVVTALVGALMSLLMMSIHRFSLALAFERVGCAHASRVLIGRALPYGVAIAAGGIAVAAALAAQTY